MADDIEPDFPPPPPADPKVEDAFTAMPGVVMPKKAKRFKVIFNLIGTLEIAIGAYLCVFGVATSIVSATWDNNLNIGPYAGICGVGLFVLAAGGLKKSKYKNSVIMTINLMASLIGALLACAIAGLCIWHLLDYVNISDKPDEKLPILPQIVAAIMLLVALILFVHLGGYCAGSKVSQKPIRATMYTNVNTGEQFMEYENKNKNKKGKERREKRVAQSFNVGGNREIFPVSAGDPKPPKSGQEDIPMGSLVRPAKSASKK